VLFAGSLLCPLSKLLSSQFNNYLRTNWLNFANGLQSAWDAQIEADAGSGKLDALAAEALAEYHNGMAREL
jgi:hypothetical protein